VDYRFEVAELPVTDVDRSLRFYTAQLGFNLDVDYQPDGHFRVVQLTPPGSSCSVHLEQAVSVEQPHTNVLVVTDLEAAQRELKERGLDPRNVRHKEPLDTWAGGWESGIDPGRHDYASFAEVIDPDGHIWVIQERGHAS
jgi:catechol 2,3-dioxygenase-like lactoylglutathione lyase family enzyme